MHRISRIGPRLATVPALLPALPPRLLVVGLLVVGLLVVGASRAVPAAEPWVVRKVLQTPPGATPPPAPARGDESALWRALDDGDWREFEELQMRARRHDPSWQPSARLEAAWRRAVQEEAIEVAKRADDHAALEDLYSAAPELFRCRSVDHLWQLAEGRFERGDTDGGLEIYREVIETCPPEFRLATLQMARGRLAAKEVRDLIELPGRSHPDEAALLVDVQRELDMRRFGDEVAQLAAAAPQAEVGAEAPVDLAWLAAEATRLRDGPAAVALGWWHHRQQAFEPAREWFELARDWGESEEAINGLAVVSAARGDHARASALALAHPDLVDGAERLVAEAERQAVREAHAARAWQRCVDLADALEVPRPEDRLLAGWCAFESGDLAGALRRFETIGGPDVPPAVLADARRARRVAAEALADGRYLRAMALEGWLTVAERRELVRGAVRLEFLRAYELRQFRRAVELAREYRAEGGRFEDGEALLEGWAFFNAGNCWDARVKFEQLARHRDEEIAAEAVRGRRLARDGEFSETCGLF